MFCLNLLIKLLIMKKYLFSTLIILTVFFAFTSIRINAAESTTYYIGTNGSDSSGNGTIDNPWKTFNKGIGELPAGGTLRALEGNYNETIRVKESSNGTSSNPIIIESNPGDSVDVSHNSDHTLNIEGDNVIFRNIEISQAGGMCVIVRDTANNITLGNLEVHGCETHGINIFGDNVTVKDSSIYNSNLDNENSSAGNWGSGLKTSREAENITLTNNNVYKNWGEGIAITKTLNATLTGNTAYDNFGVNVYIDNSVNVLAERNFSYCTDNSSVKRDNKKANSYAIGEESYSETPLWGNQLSNIKIINNIGYNCYRGISYWGADTVNSGGYRSGGLRNSAIVHNTFSQIEDRGISFENGSNATENNVQFYNNIIESKSGRNIYIEGNQGIINIDYNFWVGGLNSSDTISLTGNDQSASDPLFMSAPSTNPQNFKLQAISAAVNSGTSTIPSLSNVTTDFSKSLRDATPDMGAFELAGGEPMDTTRFPDVPSSDIFYTYIENLAADNVINGYPDGTYGPKKAVIRGAMAKYTVNAFNLEINTSCGDFADVPKGHSFYEYITTLKCHEIIKGVGNNNFDSDGEVTRGQVTKFIINTMEFKKGSPATCAKTHTFPDVTGHTFDTYISCLSNIGTNDEKVIKGFTWGKFEPNTTLQRDQMAKIIEVARKASY